MQKFRTLADMVALAEFAHRNQVDKAGMPYIEHPKRVMQSLQAQGTLPYVQMGGVLHDVTEDTAFTPEMLLALGVPDGAVEIVTLCDRNHSAALFREENAGRDLSYDKFPLTGRYYYPSLGPFAEERFYYHRIRQNEGAKSVKLADIHDNTQKWRLLYLPEKTQERLHVKYTRSDKFLTGPLDYEPDLTLGY